ncbi:MAG: sigma-54-dependent Fis family transcriptional regulator [Proteobacteria bacterium]|nr:sigma-54-dependent Fis family transcriptional regulator [Pseudomonadota bacterium]
MAQPLRLESAEREFLRLVAQAAFSNPFGEERTELHQAIAGCMGAVSDREGFLPRLIARVSESVSRIEKKGVALVARYPAEDRDLVQIAFLFEIYYRFVCEFERLTVEQARSGTVCHPVPFAREALSLLLQRGFGQEEAIRYFAMFDQLYRAFYFINHGLVGRSPSMKKLRLHLWRNVFTKDVRWYVLHLWDRLEDFSTLLLGETGTGKGTAAAAIGRSGFIPFDPERGCFVESFTRNFIAINLSQFPESLIESELFGHRKGSFTGAIGHHEGVLARCSRYGAIFLDEVGELAPAVQIKLLQVLQDRTFSEVGGHEKKRFPGRVIAATNQPLDELLCTGRMRLDFYYRLCSDEVVVPPLRQRLQEDPQEFEDLLLNVLERMMNAPPAELIGEVRQGIEDAVGPGYNWPGNVRELEQAARRAVLTGTYSVDRSCHGPDLLDRIRQGVEEGTIAARDLLASYCALLYRRHGTIDEVARRAGLDRRTARRYIRLAAKQDQEERVAAAMPLGAAPKA